MRWICGTEIYQHKGDLEHISVIRLQNEGVRSKVLKICHRDTEMLKCILECQFLSSDERKASDSEV